MRNIFQAKNGLITKAKELYQGGFNLNRFWKWMAEEMNVPMFDKCCDSAATASVPTRFNQEGGVFQYFNGTNWVSTGITLKTNSIVESTAASGVTVDGVLLKDGGVSANSMLAGFFPTAAQQALSGAGAINVTSYHTALTTTGANALTLANGTQIGQRKKITMVVDGGDGTLTPTSLSTGTTITFNDAGDFVEMIWNGSAWVVIQNSGTTIA